MAEDLAMSILGAAQAIAPVAAQAIASQEDKHAQRRAFEYNMKMAEYQNEVNIRNWQMQNEYNAPSATMNRLKAAGLNPNLVYNNGSATQAASALPAMPGATMQAYQGHYRTAEAVSGMLDGALKAVGIKRQEQEISNLAASQRVTELDAEMRELQLVAQGYANAKSKEEAEIWRDYYDEMIIGMRAKNMLTDSQRFYTDAQKDYVKGPQTDMTRQSIVESKQRVASSIAEMSLIEYRKSLLTAQTADALSRVGVNNATANKIAHEITSIDWDVILKDTTNIGKSIDNEINSIILKTGVDFRNPNLVKDILRKQTLMSMPHYVGAGGSW